MTGKKEIIETQEKNRRDLVDMHYLLTQVSGLSTPAAKALRVVVDEGISPGDLEKIVRAARRFATSGDTTRRAILGFISAKIFEDERKEVEKDMAETDPGS